MLQKPLLLRFFLFQQFVHSNSLLGFLGIVFIEVCFSVLLSFKKIDGHSTLVKFSFVNQGKCSPIFPGEFLWAFGPGDSLVRIKGNAVHLFQGNLVDIRPWGFLFLC